MTRRYPNTGRFAWLMALAFLLALLLSSCSKEYYVNKYCPKVKDSVHVERIVKDSVVYRDSIIKEPGEVIVVTDTVPCPDMVIEKKGEKGKVRVEIKDSILTAECIIDTTEIAIDWIEHHKKEIMRYYREVTHVVTVKAAKTKFQVFKDYFFWIVIILGALRITFFILKKTGVFPIQIKRSG